MKPIRSRKFKSRQPIYRRKGLLKGILIVLLFGVLLYLVLFSSAFRREQLVIEGNNALESREIERVADNFLGQRMVDSLIWPIGNLSLHLKEAFPYIKEATVSRRWFHAIIISLKEKEPAYCLETREGFFVLDKEGVLLEEFEVNCPGQLPIIVFTEGSEHYFSELPILENTWRQITETRETLLLFPELNLDRIQIGDFRIEVIMDNPVFEQPDWTVYLDRTMELAKQLRRLELFLQTKTLEEISRLDYVDVGGHQERVFYADRPKN